MAAVRVVLVCHHHYSSCAKDKRSKFFTPPLRGVVALVAWVVQSTIALTKTHSLVRWTRSLGGARSLGRLARSLGGLARSLGGLARWARSLARAETGSLVGSLARVVARSAWSLGEFASSLRRLARWRTRSLSRSLVREGSLAWGCPCSLVRGARSLARSLVRGDSLVCSVVARSARSLA